jgi:hypothetical protein
MQIRDRVYSEASAEDLQGALTDVHGRVVKEILA